MSFSLLLFTFACYQKRKSYKNGAGGAGKLFNLGKNLNNVGFHRYNELVLNSDEETLTTTKSNDKSSLPVVNYSKKNGTNRYSKLDTGDNKKLLFTDDDEDDDDQNENIFVR